MTNVMTVGSYSFIRHSKKAAVADIYPTVEQGRITRRLRELNLKHLQEGRGAPPTGPIGEGGITISVTVFQRIYEKPI